jgi:signal transduction histidine kinase
MSLSEDILLDEQRLRDLAETELMDSSPQEYLDRYSRLASLILQVPVTLLSFVGADRQFFISQVGLSEPFATERQTLLSHSFCKYVVSTGETLNIPDARKDPLVQENPAITDLGVVAYLGIPVFSDQQNVLGSFCAIDGQPRLWTDEQVNILKGLAAAVSTEIQLRAAKKRLEATNQKLVKAEVNQNHLVHLIVHELRAPLSSFLSGIEMVQITGPLNAEQEACLKLAQRGGEDLLEMIDDLLDVHTLEKGELILNLAIFDAEEIAVGAVSQLRYLATEKSQSLQLKIAPNLPAVQGDSVLIKRVCSNLLNHAIKNTPEHGDIIFSLDACPENSGVLFRIHDHGPRIPPEQLDHVFEKFGLMDGQRLRQMPVTGLGLTYSQMIIQAHSSKIEVVSDESEGNTFSFKLSGAEKFSTASAA